MDNKAYVSRFLMAADQLVISTVGPSSTYDSILNRILSSTHPPNIVAHIKASGSINAVGLDQFIRVYLQSYGWSGDMRIMTTQQQIVFQ